MARLDLKAGALLSPVPPTLVTCGTAEHPNVLTVAWTGIVCTRPHMTYISLRPTRHSHALIRETGSFVINLPTSEMARIVDLCGMKTGAKDDKLALCKLETAPAKTVEPPILTACPVSLECRVTEEKDLGSHTMFLAEITNVSVDERCLDPRGRLDLKKAGLLAYVHGEYLTLGKKCGDFGFSVRKKRSRKPRKDKR